jgi:Glyoxalase superfamily protein
MGKLKGRQQELMCMEKTQVIPVLRIFDYKKTIEFYIEWLGFVIDWEQDFI